MKSKPIKRPSLPGTLGDTHHRVRTMEAAQTMPYWAGATSFTWYANEVKAGEGWTGFQSDTVCSVSAWDLGTVFDTPFDGASGQFTTDGSIFLQNPGGGHAIAILGGGLWQWMCQVTVEDLAGAPGYASAFVYWYNRMDYDSTFRLPPEVNMQTPGTPPDNTGLVDYPYAANFGFTGMFSFNGWDTGGEVPGALPNALNRRASLIYVSKNAVGYGAVDPSLDWSVSVSFFVWRLSPVGNWPTTVE